MKLGDDFWKNEEKLTTSENIDLEAPFTEEEIKAAVRINPPSNEERAGVGWRTPVVEEDAGDSWSPPGAEE